MGSDRKAVRIPATVLGRASKLIGAGASIMGREMLGKLSGSKDASLRVKQATDLVHTLSHLKGAAMKAGQFLSLEFSDMLPPEVTDVLRKLHDDSTMMPFKKIESILKEELGERMKDISNLSIEPLASASIGQVHTACLEGKPVAIKVQFPGVADSIDSDINLLRKIVESMLMVRRKQASFDGVFEEMRDALHMEVDYLKEADALLRYRQAFGSVDGYHVPAVYKEYSSQRVLTLSFEEGIRIHDFLNRDLTEVEKHAFATRVLNLLTLEFFEVGLVQTDPNYGNFLIREEDKSLILLDFGATKFYDADFRSRVRELLKLAFECKRQELIERAMEFELLDVRESAEVREMFCDLMETVVYMFRPEVQPFSFADTDYLAEIREVTMKFANVVQYTAPARHMIFLNRKLGGMFHLLKDADCTIDLTPFWEKVLEMELCEHAS